MPQPALLLLAGVLLASTRAHAQSSRYRTQPDTLYYIDSNPYRMFFVRATDTLSFPSLDRSIDRQVWRSDRGRLSIAQRTLDLNVDRKITTETFTIDSTGRVLLVDGQPPGLNTRVDLVPILPGAPMRPGVQWTDTLRADAEGAGGAHRFQIVRTYQVEQVADSGRLRVARVTASGAVLYQHGWWIDSTAGTYSWINVSGPMSERYTFDLSQGRILERTWEMQLRGIGGGPGERGRVDTLPAGLTSASHVRLITPDQARILGRDLVGRDSSWTQTRGRILLHTVERKADTVRSSLARNDGLVGSVSSVYQKNRPSSFEALWTDSIGTVKRYRIAIVGRVLRIQTPDGEKVDTAPAQLWGIADFAMQEHLVPVLLSLPVDTLVSVAVYRPVGGHWDRLTVMVRPLETGFLVSAEKKGDKAQYLVLDPEGDLLYGENSDPLEAVRSPAEGSARHRRLQMILEEIRELGSGSN